MLHPFDTGSSGNGHGVQRRWLGTRLINYWGGEVQGLGPDGDRVMIRSCSMEGASLEGIGSTDYLRELPGVRGPIRGVGTVVWYD